MQKRKVIAACLPGIIAIIAFFNFFCSSSDKKTSEPVYLNHNDTVKYVGMDQCRACHNEIYKTFIQTGMGQSFAAATRQKSAADFSKHHVVYDQHTDLSYFPFFRNDSMYIMEFRLEGRDTVHKRVERVDYIVGSGQHTNSHMMNVNGFLFQLPLTWYAQKKKWDLPPGYENGHNVRFSRAIGFECMSCHNALPGFADNSLNKFTNVPQGIDCERCHGPGEVHVKEKLAGVRVDTATQIDYTIVNPGKLPWDKQIDVCQRCHLQGNVVLKEGKTFRDFRPGMVLSDFMDIYMPKYKGHEDEFIMASHAQRLQMSRCFVSGNSGGGHTKLTCITCHNPHISVKVTGRQIFNNACGRCHDMVSACKEDIKVRKAVNDNCVQCHMPKSGTIDIPHVSVTDHWIRVPVKAGTREKVKEFAGIYCINNPRSDESTRCRAYISYYEKFEGEKNSLDSAIIHLPAAKDNVDAFTEMRIHLMYLKNDYHGIVKAVSSINPATVNNPWMCYRTGQAYQNIASPSMAEAWYKRAVALAPENTDFMNKLGTVVIEQNRLDEGIKILHASLEKNPKQSAAWTNMGFAYLKKGDIATASGCYDKAIALDPDFEQALLNKAGLYNYQGKKKEAAAMLRRILKHNPGNEQVRALLQSL